MKRFRFIKLLRAHKDRVFSYALYFLHNREDAEDVTQEVFVRLWENLDGIDQSRAGAWIVKVTHNRCIDWARRRKTVDSRVRIADQGLLENLPSEGKPVVHSRLSDREIADTREMLLEALGTLPERTRSMLLLHYYQGLKYETIARIMDAKTNAVKTAVHRGRKSLRRALDKHFPEKTERYKDEYPVS